MSGIGEKSRVGQEDTSLQTAMTQSVSQKDREEENVEELKLSEWVTRMSMVVKNMTVFTEEIAGKVVRLGAGRDVLMEKFNSEKEKAQSLLRELEGTEVVGDDLAEALDAAGIHTSGMMIRVLETGGKANDIVENLEHLLKVKDEVIANKVGVLAEQVSGVAKILGCEEEECVLACEKMFEENNTLKKMIRKQTVIKERIQSSNSVQRLLNRSCYSMNNDDTLEIDGIRNGLGPLKTSTPFGSKDSSHESAFFGNNSEPLEIQRASNVNDYYSDSNARESVFESLLKAQVMPPIGDFYGNPDEDLERYLRVFMTRYNDQLFSDEILKDIFVEKLKGVAREIYLALPDGARGFTFMEIVAHLKGGLKRDKRLDEVSAVSRMRMLKLAPGQLLHYCNDMEKLSLKAYPNMNLEELSFIRSEQLYQQVAHWKDSLRLAEILETGSKSEMYDKMKDCALRMERINNLRIRSNRMENFVNEEVRFRSEQRTLPASKVMECYNCGEKGHRQFECRKPKSVQRPGNGPLQNVGNVIVQHETRPKSITERVREAIKAQSSDYKSGTGSNQLNHTYYVGSCKMMKPKRHETYGKKDKDSENHRRSTRCRCRAEDYIKPVYDNHRRPFHNNYRRQFYYNKTNGHYRNHDV